MSLLERIFLNIVFRLCVVLELERVGPDIVNDSEKTTVILKKVEPVSSNFKGVEFSRNVNGILPVVTISGNGGAVNSRVVMKDEIFQCIVPISAINPYSNRFY